MSVLVFTTCLSFRHLLCLIFGWTFMFSFEHAIFFALVPLQKYNMEFFWIRRRQHNIYLKRTSACHNKILTNFALEKFQMHDLNILCKTN